MAWPLSRLTSYSAGNLPAIKAADLNELQDAVGKILTGVWTFKSLDVDGTGGAAGAAPAGVVRTSGLLTGTTAPTPAHPIGTLGRGSVPAGWAVVSPTGSLIRGYNVFSVGRYPGIPNGGYLIVFSATPADPDNPCVWANSSGLGAPRFIEYFSDFLSGKFRLYIGTYTAGGTPFDTRFSCGFFGE